MFFEFLQTIDFYSSTVKYFFLRTFYYMSASVPGPEYAFLKKVLNVTITLNADTCFELVNQLEEKMQQFFSTEATP